MYMMTAGIGCPNGWSLGETVSGRFPVALPYNGQPGATFGGDSVDAGEI
jgi:hypothetical protein